MHGYHSQLAIDCVIFGSISVSAKFVFGTDMKVVTECSEEHQDFVRGMSSLTGIFFRVMMELPLYKLYDNKLSREFKSAIDVSYYIYS